MFSYTAQPQAYISTDSRFSHCCQYSNPIGYTAYIGLTGPEYRRYLLPLYRTVVNTPTLLPMAMPVSGAVVLLEANTFQCLHNYDNHNQCSLQVNLLVYCLNQYKF